jgi:two-component system, NtrC family, sensor kinase
MPRMAAPGTILIAAHANVRHARVLVEVSDTGPGIAPEVMPHVFDAFFTTKDRAQHLGLGLTRARQAVRGYGGELGGSSVIGVGSTFTFDLPCSERRA